MVNTMSPNFKPVNIILFICIAVLSYEIYILATQQSDMLATIQALNEKLAETETGQQSDILATIQALDEKLAEIENGLDQKIDKNIDQNIEMLIGVAITLIVITMALLYFSGGGIDPGDLSGARTQTNDLLNHLYLNLTPRGIGMEINFIRLWNTGTTLAKFMAGKG